MKSRFAPIVVVALFFLTACSSTWNTYTRLYVQNTTADSFQVFITYPPSDSSASLKIMPGTTRFLDSYYLEDESGPRTSRNTDVWLYHYNDTTWTLLSNHSLDPEFTNRYIKYMLTDNVEIRALNPNYNDRILTLTINDNLMQEMLRDTLVSDSIFGVR